MSTSRRRNALRTLDKAFMRSVLVSHSPSPGSVIIRMGDEDRKCLVSLKSNDIRSARIEGMI